MKAVFSFILAFALLTSAPARAADFEDVLYIPEPPAGMAFLRFINADPKLEDQDDSPTLNGKESDPVPFGSISSYVPVPAGEVVSSFHGGRATMTAEAGKFYTQVLKADRIETLTDVLTEDNPIKVQVMFYNLSTQDNLSLKTTDGSLSITSQPVPRGKSEARAVNSVKLDAGVYSEQGKVAAVPTTVLDRGKVYSIVVINEGDGTPRVIVQTNATDTDQ